MYNMNDHVYRDGMLYSMQDNMHECESKANGIHPKQLVTFKVTLKETVLGRIRTHDFLCSR